MDHHFMNKICNVCGSSILRFFSFVPKFKIFFDFWALFEVSIFFSLSTHPVNSIYSVVVRIYKILVIDEAFFFFFPFLQSLPGKVGKYLFPVSLLNIEANSFNIILQVINQNYNSNE